MSLRFAQPTPDLGLYCLRTILILQASGSIFGTSIPLVANEEASELALFSSDTFGLLVTLSPGLGHRSTLRGAAIDISQSR